MIKRTIRLIIAFTAFSCMHTRAADTCALLLERARLLILQRDSKKAIPLIDSCLKKDPRNAMANNLRGCATIYSSYINDEKNNELAVFYFSKAIENDPGNYGYYNNRGWAYANLDDYIKANADYKKAVQIDSSNIALQQNILRVMVVKNRNKEAYAYSNKLIQQFPKDGYAYYIRGNLKRDYLHKYPEGNKDIKLSEALGWDQGMYLMF